jgi:sterol desaturase/sphingolipid hydroxylase (fatty acid hydroxylase superfamily)
VVVGLSAQAVTYFLYATMFLSVFQHTNVRTPQWLGYFVQRPESHSVHHGRGVHQYNHSDLPLFDILFGTFRNPKDFVRESVLRWRFGESRADSRLQGYCGERLRPRDEGR